MRRTTLMVDMALLNEATHALGQKTYSATVNAALADAVRTSKILQLSSVFGAGLWQGNLSEMREDAPAVPIKPSKRKAKAK